jgi:probable addiction module antidote protein
MGVTTMTKAKLRKWDSVEHLHNEEDIASYFDAVLQEAGDDPAFIAHALGIIARARGMSQLARDTGLGRESLYKALSGDSNPSLGTILKVVKALGLKLHATAT